MEDRRFKKFDYGPEKNRELYSSDVPPDYDLSKIKTPVAIFVGKQDVFCRPKDAEVLSEMLGNMVYKYVISRDNFGHFDFCMQKTSYLFYIHMY
ncbi:hypothetical protein HHI36_009462 [Cryptolaemus montrouzieri]|uniref:Uncharacterized protein n=1 Tax=Cryptolaemus montrouzieri TaxID=559131 RepID=A0ABD2MFP5_9CUCU